MRNAICMTAALFLGITPAFSQGTAKRGERQPTPEEDIRAIRQMMEEQALKVEAINQEVAKISQKLAELQQAQAAPVTKAPEEPATAPAVPADGSPAGQPAIPAAQANSSAAPLTSGSNPVHVVTKGETLTSIARHAKVTVADLLKLNKIENDRNLQIGQTLILPIPKPQEPPAANPPK